MLKKKKKKNSGSQHTGKGKCALCMYVCVFKETSYKASISVGTQLCHIH